MSTETVTPAAAPVNRDKPDAIDQAITAAVREHSAQVWGYEGPVADNVADLWVTAHRDLLRAVVAAVTDRIIIELPPERRWLK